MKGAVLLLEDGEREGLDEETSPAPTSPAKESGGASDKRHRQLHAMVELLRPEDTIKLVRPRVHVHFANQISKTLKMSCKKRKKEFCL